MNSFANKSVDEIIELCENNFSKKVSLNMGLKFHYYVVPQELDSDWENFVFGFSDDNSTYVISICESIPLNIQKYFALTEYLTLTLDINDKELLLEIEKMVLSQVPEVLLMNYLELKISMLSKKIELSEEAKELDKAVIDYLKKTLEDYMEYRMIFREYLE